MPSSPIRSVFSNIDSNRDRSLSKNELSGFVRGAGVSSFVDTAATRLRDTFDSDRSGDVSWSEFSRGATNLVPSALKIDPAKARSDPKHIEDRTKQFFSARDSSRDGKLSAGELAGRGGIAESIKAKLAVHALGGSDRKISRGEMISFLKGVFR